MIRLASAWFLSVWIVAVGAFASEPADAPREGTEAAAVSLACWPKTIEFQYLSDRHRLIVQATTADGGAEDVTDEAVISTSDASVASVRDGVVTPRGKGRCLVQVRWKGAAAEAEVIVPEGSQDQRPLRFRNDILPRLTRAGCNSGKCHGAASGKDGFRLSLFGYDPEGDYFRLTREHSGRRIRRSRPESCLLVQKAIGEAPHTGGGPIEFGSPDYCALVSWLAEGARRDPAETPEPTGVEVVPPEAVLGQPGRAAGVVVIAAYSDGSRRDVTDLAVFLSNNDAVVSVNGEGRMLANGPGAAFVLARFDQFTAGAPVVVRPGEPFQPADFPPRNYIDEIALERWNKLHLQPSELCSDEVFLRRVSLDLAGELPSPELRRQFLDDPGSDKRDRLIEQLVQRKEFLDLWIMRLAEMMQIRRANGLSPKGLRLYDAWLRDRVHSGVSVDQIVRELIPATGSTFDSPPAIYYQTETTPQLIAENIAQAFLGMRIQCAQCHNHPFDRWTMDDYYGFAGFVSRVGYKQGRDPREITIFDAKEGSLKHPVGDREVAPRFLGGDAPELDDDEDYREPLAAWLTSPDNRAFANHIANVVWEQMFGQGLVTPVDDVRVSNPPAIPELLDALGSRLVEYEFDVRRLAEDIGKSRTYQLATSGNRWNEHDDRHFSRARIRRLRAEVLLDCINQVTGAADDYAGLPLGGRAIQIPDGRSNNYFLETFGRASRDTPCACEVSTAPTLSQALHLLNGENTTGKIDRGDRVGQWLREGASPWEVAQRIFVACYCRQPTPDEASRIQQRLDAADDPESELQDLFWAVLNSNEFLFNH